jgi:glycosyltransferase involved in cell wall biosynthesis
LRQLNPGGIECWLQRLIQHWPEQSRPEFHFALEERDFGTLSQEFLRLGVNLHYCPPPRQWLSEPRAFAQLLESLEPLQVIHCHNHFASALHLSIAARMGVPIRISQSHADFRRSNSGVRQVYAAICRRLLRGAANVKLAVGKGAALDLFGEEASTARILPCGSSFEALLGTNRKADDSRFTLVHVGRLAPEKNHEFLLQLLLVMRKREPRARLWLVGDGPQRPLLEARVQELELGEAVQFWGNQRDLASIFAAADAFVFPSHAEGLGLAALEAQAAGVPCWVAAHLPEELNLIPELVHRLALELPILMWVESILENRTACTVTEEQRRRHFERSAFSIETNLAALQSIYAN